VFDVRTRFELLLPISRVSAESNAGPSVCSSATECEAKLPKDTLACRPKDHHDLPPVPSLVPARHQTP